MSTLDPRGQRPEVNLPLERKTFNGPKTYRRGTVAGSRRQGEVR